MYVCLVFAIKQHIKKLTMKTLKIIIKQLIKIVTLDKSYPTAEINLMFWEYEFKNETVEYNQFRTLINYLKYNN